MDKKKLIRLQFLKKRKKNYFEINDKFFNPLIRLIKKIKNKKKNISLYYPSNYEVNVLKILNIAFFAEFTFSLPVIKKNNHMDFFIWKKNDILYLNNYGILEPISSKKVNPSIILVPLIAYDRNKNRIGYGKGYYDRYLNSYLNRHKKTLTIGVAFSFQKHHKLPADKNDFKLDFIITEKGIIK